MWPVLTVSLSGKTTVVLSSVTGSLLLGVGWGRVLSFAFGGPHATQEDEASPVGPVESRVR